MSEIKEYYIQSYMYCFLQGNLIYGFIPSAPATEIFQLDSRSGQIRLVRPDRLTADLALTYRVSLHLNVNRIKFNLVFLVISFRLI